MHQEISPGLARRAVSRMREEAEASLPRVIVPQLFPFPRRNGGRWFRSAGPDGGVGSDLILNMKTLCANQPPEPTRMTPSILRLSVLIHPATVPAYPAVAGLFR